MFSSSAFIKREHEEIVKTIKLKSIKFKYFKSCFFLRSVQYPIYIEIFLIIQYLVVILSSYSNCWVFFNILSDNHLYFKLFIHFQSIDNIFYPFNNIITYFYLNILLQCTLKYWLKLAKWNNRFIPIYKHEFCIVQY